MVVNWQIVTLAALVMATLVVFVLVGGMQATVAAPILTGVIGVLVPSPMGKQS